MSKIKNIFAREIKDSRGNPTVEVELETGRGAFVASVASGASTGTSEALELRDDDGRGVLKAIENVNKIIAPKLKGKDSADQKQIDKLMIELDGTENKSKLGANAILPVSMAVCRAGADFKDISVYGHIADLAGWKLQTTNYKFPFGMFNILNGGAHVHPHTLDIQEFMIIPQKKTFFENLALCNKIFNNLTKNIEKNFGKESLLFGDEGGFSPPIFKTEQALFMLKSAAEGEADVKFGLDCAASEFYNEGKYGLDGRKMAREELLILYNDLAKNFPIISIEDPFSEEDWQGFEEIMAQMGKEISIIGDDLTATNIKRIKEAHNKNACNGVIIKLNQIGTVSEAIEASNLAKSFGWKTAVSHRSGETMDNFIADLAVGTGADFIKAGSPAKEERMAKYQRLLEIEKELSQK